MKTQRKHLQAAQHQDIQADKNTRKQRLTAEDERLFDGASRPSVARRDGPTKRIFEGPNKPNPRIDGPPTPASLRFQGSPGQRGGGGPMRFEGPQGQLESGCPLRFEGPQRPGGTPLRFKRPLRQAGGGGLRFKGAVGLQFEGPTGGLRFEGPAGQNVGGLRFEGPHCQPVGGMRFEGSHSASGSRIRFEGHHGQPGGRIIFEGPLLQQGGRRRFEGPSVQGGSMRFEGPLGQGGPRFEGCHVSRFDGQPGQPSFLPRSEGLHDQYGPGFERTPGQQGPQRFDGPPGQQVKPRLGPQRFDGPQHLQASRFDIPLGLQGARFDNPPSQRLDDSDSFSHTGPYNDPPNSALNAPSQGRQFQRHEEVFDSPQEPNFNGPHGPGAQKSSNPLKRASGHYFEEKNPQGPQYGNFSNLPTPTALGNIQPPQQLVSGVTQPVSLGQGQQFLPVHAQNPGTFVQNPAGALPRAYPDNHLSQVDVHELFSKLLKTGILKLSQPDSATTQGNDVAAQPPPEEEEETRSEHQDVPDLTNFTVEELKQRYASVINRLYTGIQCSSCGLRFTSQADDYAHHLDWHYRQNRAKKDVSRKVTHRMWYCSVTDWIEFEGIADEEHAKSQVFEKLHEEVLLKNQEAAKEKEFQSVPAGPAGAVESCEICQEQFDQYWDQEEEEWHLKNAIRVDGKTYHPSCYEDY